MVTGIANKAPGVGWKMKGTRFKVVGGTVGPTGLRPRRVGLTVEEAKVVVMGDGKEEQIVATLRGSRTMEDRGIEGGIGDKLGEEFGNQ